MHQIYQIILLTYLKKHTYIMYQINSYIEDRGLQKAER